MFQQQVNIPESTQLKLNVARCIGFAIPNEQKREQSYACCGGTQMPVAL